MIFDRAAARARDRVRREGRLAVSRVATVEAIPVSYPEPNDFNALRHLCLVKITTDDGVVGWGESITQFPEANFAAKAIIEGMAARVVGRDPLENRAIWHSHQATRRGGTATAAASPATRSRAIDIALWDIKGKLLGTSACSNLLGGPVHERLPAIASCHAHYEDIGAMVEEAQEWVAPGLHGRQGRLRQARQRAPRLRARPRRRVHAARCARGSARTRWLMIDCGWNVKWDVTDGGAPGPGVRGVRPGTGSRSRSAPGTPRATRTCASRRRRSSPTARRSGTSTGFERVLATGTVDVVGIDPGRAEGITGFKRAAERIECYRRQANAHAWSSAICLRGQPGDELQLAGLQAVRVQAAAQPDAARPGDRAVRARRRLGLPADRARASASR